MTEVSGAHLRPSARATGTILWLMSLVSPWVGSPDHIVLYISVDWVFSGRMSYSILLCSKVSHSTIPGRIMILIISVAFILFMLPINDGGVRT